MRFCKTTDAVLAALVVLLGLVAPAAGQTVVQGTRARITERAVIGGATMPTSGVLRLVGVPARTTGQSVLSVNGSGDVTAGALGRLDLPAEVGFEDEANVWTGTARWSGAASLPNLTAIGADNIRLGISGAGRPRIVLEDAGSSQILIQNQDGEFSVRRLDAAGSSTLGGIPIAATDILTLGPASNLVLPATAYTLQLGSPLRKILAVHAAELRVESLVADETMATTRGRLLVLPTTSLVEALPDSATTIKVKHNNLANGDRVYLESDGRVEFMAVTSAATKINRIGSANNASIESSVVSWGSDGVVSITSSDDARYVGARGLRWVYTSGTPNVYNNVPGTLANSTQYTASVFVKRRSGGAIVPSASAWRMYLDGVVGPRQATAIDMGDGWYRLYVTGTTSATANSVVGLADMATDTEVFVDGLQVELGATLTPFSLDSSSYTVTRNLDGSGADDWEAGAAVANTGQAGNGWIDLYSNRGVKASSEVGPSIVGNVRVSSTYNDWAPRWAVGNLQGLYGYASTTFGAAFGNPSAANVTIDPTNGVRIRYGASNRLQADAAGTLSLVSGQVSIDANGMQIATTNVIEDVRAYRFTDAAGTGAGYFGVYGYATSSERFAYLNAARPSGTASTAIRADSGSADASVTAYANATVGAAEVQITADYWTRIGTASQAMLRISHNQSSSNPGSPWIRSDGGYFVLNANGPLYFNLDIPAQPIIMVGAYTQAKQFYPMATNTYNLGDPTLRWNEIYFNEPTTTTNGLFPLVSASGRIMAKSNGLNGTTTCAGAQRVSSITFSFGIAVAIVCS